MVGAPATELDVLQVAWIHPGAQCPSAESNSCAMHGGYFVMPLYRRVHDAGQAMGVDAARAASHSLAAMTNSPAPAPGGSGDLISSALGTKTRAELYEIMAQMKSLVQQNPEQARQILVQNAQLTKALFQAEIMLGMVKGAPVVPVPVSSSIPTTCCCQKPTANSPVASVEASVLWYVCRKKVVAHASSGRDLI